MDISINANDTIDYITLQKMKFLYNALDNGWAIVKKGGVYRELPASSLCFEKLG